MGKRQSRPWIVSDELWSLTSRCCPSRRRSRWKGDLGCPTAKRCAGSCSSSTPAFRWEYLPQELGFGSGMTCWRRLAAWNEAGVWEKLHQLLLNKLRSKNQLDWFRGVNDSSHVRAARRGPKADPARSPAHGRAVSTTSSPTARASRSRCR
ncbi:transposase [Streptomyces werraensis]|uniref:transposase n=1 Tax=Streptomyces werraensis TaxID=68284 RepID=UPI0033ABE1A2